MTESLAISEGNMRSREVAATHSQWREVYRPAVQEIRNRKCFSFRSQTAFTLYTCCFLIVHVSQKTGNSSPVLHFLNAFEISTWLGRAPLVAECQLQKPTSLFHATISLPMVLSNLEISSTNLPSQMKASMLKNLSKYLPIANKAYTTKTGVKPSSLSEMAELAS